MLPYMYKVEYAKSDKSKCYACKSNIEKNHIRIAINIKPKCIIKALWHHETCFFKNGKRLGTINQFDKFNTLKYCDLKRIRGKLVNPVSHNLNSDSEHVTSTLNEIKQIILSECAIEESKNSKASCRYCLLKIVKEDIRISKLQYEQKYGEIKYWFHLKCFSEIKNEYDIHVGGESLPGFEKLSEENRKLVTTLIRKQKTTTHEDLQLKCDNLIEIKHELDSISQSDIEKELQSENEEATNLDIKAELLSENDEINNELQSEKQDEMDFKCEVDIKKELDPDNEDNIEGILKSQNELFHKYRSDLQTLSKNDLEFLCKQNGLLMFKGITEPLDLLADCMAFGVLQRCPQCGGQLQLKTFSYQCAGFENVWSKCHYQTTKPCRHFMSVPNELMHYSALKNYKASIGERFFMQEDCELLPTPPKKFKKKSVAPLKNLLFYIHLKSDEKEMIKRRVLRLGGCNASKLVENVAAVITNKKALENKTHLVQKLEEFHIVEETFLDEVESRSHMPLIESIKLIETHNISESSSDIYSRVPQKIIEGKAAKVSGDKYSFYNTQVSTLKVKDGVPIVMGADLEERTHVYKELGEPYSAILNRVDFNATFANNFSYTLQLLEADNSKRYFVVKSWGVIGTTPEMSIRDFESNLPAAKEFFKKTFWEKTGNHWAARNNFEKKHGKYDLLEMADWSNRTDVKELCLESQSEIPSTVQHLLILLFDINIMHKTIADIEVDSNRMPLGVPSDKQIAAGFEILSDLLGRLEGGYITDIEVRTLSNMFYTKIPHRGKFKLKLLDDVNYIRSKIRMLHDLKNTHISYNLLEEEMYSAINRMERYYMKLKTEIVTLHSESKEYNIIMSYFTNSQSTEHSYDMHIEQIFKVEREGELERFNLYKSLGNRKLLWHGSRVSNIAAILLQGLRIAPEGVHLTGSMFGKGIYFADVVSKSAQYLYTTPDHPHGVLLLCDVVLGNMKVCFEQEPIEELPKDTHSVWGVGRIHPDPDDEDVLPDGTIVPLGVVVPNKDVDPEEVILKHNEFIVYNEGQVNIKYLVQLQCYSI